MVGAKENWPTELFGGRRSTRSRRSIFVSSLSGCSKLDEKDVYGTERSGGDRTGERDAFRDRVMQLASVVSLVLVGERDMAVISGIEMGRGFRRL